MSTIGGRNAILESIADFTSVYQTAPKPLIFWDTCGLLEYIRFIYRKNNGINTLNAMIRVSNLVNNDDVYSVASELSMVEWDDNEPSVTKAVSEDLKRTEEYHSLAVETINSLLGSSKISEPISIYNIESMLRDIALNIATQTHFLKYDDISNATLLRAALKQPPAHKKHEIKDCAVWETMLQLCREINAVLGSCPVRIFYTVNTDDFADKSRIPNTFHHSLLADATLLNFCCALSIDDVNNLLP